MPFGDGPAGSLSAANVVLPGPWSQAGLLSPAKRVWKVSAVSGGTMPRYAIWLKMPCGGFAIVHTSKPAKACAASAASPKDLALTTAQNTRREKSDAGH